MVRGYRARLEWLGQDGRMDDFYLTDTESRLQPDGSRLWHVTDRWNTPIQHPNGGFVAAAMLRAAIDSFDVGRPVVASFHYLASPEPGVDARIDVDPLKLGRRIQTVHARSSHEGRMWIDMTASFTRDHEGFSHELGAPPQLPPPDQCVDPISVGMPAQGLFARVEYRFDQAPGWSVGTPSGDPTMQMWQRLAGGREIDWPALALMSDTTPPAVLELGNHKSMTVELTVHFHRLPAPGSWVATRVTTRHVAGGFHEEDSELWDDEGNLLAQSRQLGILL
jgi:acyl-CoA thioesterase